MAPGAESLHCPNCGAPADPDAQRCAYCRARLATEPCPSCFAVMFQGAAFCPRCGAGRRRAATHASTLKCPACTGDLSAVDAGAVTILECGRCDGAWVDVHAFEQICSNGESRAALLHRAVGDSPVRPERSIKYRPCARCGKMMNRINFARLSGTVVDVCRGHGTFLDAGELHAIVAFIEEGGLERLRERSLEELKDEQRRLRTAQEISKGSNTGPAAAPQRWDGPSLEKILDAIFG